MERYGVIRQDGRVLAYTFTEAEARRVLARAIAASICPGACAYTPAKSGAGLRIGVYVLVRDPGCTEYLQLVGCADPEDVKTLEALKIKALENC